MATPHAEVVRPSIEDYVIFQERLNAHTATQREVLRIRIVLLAAQDFTNLEIAFCLGCKSDTVAKWRGRFARFGRAGLLDQPRSGRPPRFSALQQAQIVSLLCQPLPAPPVSPQATPATAPFADPPVPAPSTLPPATPLAPTQQLAAPAQDVDVAAVAEATHVAAASPDRDAAAFAHAQQVAAPCVVAPAQDRLGQPSETYAQASAVLSGQGVVLTDASASTGEMAVAVTAATFADFSATATPGPTFVPSAEPVAQPSGPEQANPPSRPKSKQGQRRGNRQAKQPPDHKPAAPGGAARPRRRGKQAKKPNPQHQCFARTQPRCELDPSLLGCAQVDVYVVPMPQTGSAGPQTATSNAGPIGANLDPFTPGLLPLRVAAALGLPPDGGVVVVKTALIVATAGDLALLQAGVDPLTLPVVMAANSTTALPTEQLQAALPVLTSTGQVDLPSLQARVAQVVTATAPAKKPELKRPVGCVLSLQQILSRMEEELGFSCSRSTLSRLLKEHELKPWRYQYWIFPQAADFVKRAGPILDLYAGYWQGEALGPDEYVLSLDEKTSIQARYRLRETLQGKRGRHNRVEWGYKRGGALQYLACWDVHEGKVFGRCEAKVGIESFDRLVDEVMSQQVYASAKRVFAIMDNGSSHRGARCVARLQGRYANLTVVHLPVHASWLNQIEIYFSIIQRALLTPNDFHDLSHLETAILAFQQAYNCKAAPFAWRFTRAKLAALIDKLESHKRLAS